MKQMRVLLVDDETEFVSTLAERLSIRGIDVDWVTSGEAALEKAATRSYDLAILDVKMPKISGIQLKTYLHEKWPDMKFIFLTGHGSEQDYRTASGEAGVEYYLAKPVHIENLLEKMNQVFSKEQGPS
jgi:DNA-binding response OmpR family regulator